MSKRKGTQRGPKMTHFHEFRLELEAKVPLLLPVTVRVVPLRGFDGDTSVSELRDKFLIRIRADQSLTGLQETLLHEWAHAVAWQEIHSVEDHGPEWGMAYGRIYQAMVAR